MKLLFFLVLQCLASSQAVRITYDIATATHTDDIEVLHGIAKILDDGSYFLRCSADLFSEDLEIIAITNQDKTTGKPPEMVIELNNMWRFTTAEECSRTVFTNIRGHWEDRIAKINCINHEGYVVLEVLFTNPPNEKDMVTWNCFGTTINLDTIYYTEIKVEGIETSGVWAGEPTLPLLEIHALPDYSNKDYITLGCGVEGAVLPTVSGPIRPVTFYNKLTRQLISGDVFGRDSYGSLEHDCDNNVGAGDITFKNGLAARQTTPLDILPVCYNLADKESRFYQSNLTVFLPHPINEKDYQPPFENQHFDVEFTDYLFLYGGAALNPTLPSFTIPEVGAAKIAFKMLDEKDIVKTQLAEGGDLQMSSTLFINFFKLVAPALTYMHKLDMIEFDQQTKSFTCPGGTLDTQLFYLERPCSETQNTLLQIEGMNQCNSVSLVDMKFYPIKIDSVQDQPHVLECNFVSKHALCITNNFYTGRLQHEIKLIVPQDNSYKSMVDKISLGSFQTKIYTNYCRFEPPVVENNGHYLIHANQALIKYCESCSFLYTSVPNSPLYVYGHAGDLIDKKLENKHHLCGQRINKCVGKYSNMSQASVKIPREFMRGSWQCAMYGVKSEAKLWDKVLAEEAACEGTEFIPELAPPPHPEMTIHSYQKVRLSCTNPSPSCLEKGASIDSKIILNGPGGESKELVDGAFEFTIPMIKNFDNVTCSSFQDKKHFTTSLLPLISNLDRCEFYGDCFYSNDNHHIICYITATKFCELPPFYSLKTESGFLLGTYTLGVQVKLYSERDLGLLKIPTIPMLDLQEDVTYLFAAYKDLERRRPVKVIKATLNANTTVGTCAENNLPTILTSYVTNDEGNTQVTCSDPSFNVPGCEDVNNMQSVLYYLEVLAFSGENDEPYLGNNEIDWNRLVMIQKIHHPNGDIVWQNHYVDNKFDLVRQGEFFNIFNYNIPLSKLKSLIGNKDTLVVRCAKSIADTGEYVLNYGRLDKAVLINRQRRDELPPSLPPTVVTKQPVTQPSTVSTSTLHPLVLELHPLLSIVIIIVLAVLVLILFVCLVVRLTKGKHRDQYTFLV